MRLDLNIPEKWTASTDLQADNPIFPFRANRRYEYSLNIVVELQIHISKTKK